MKTKTKISIKIFAAIMLFSFSNLLAYNIVQLKCGDSCEIHDTKAEETCHTKTVEKSCCTQEETEQDESMDLADCSCDHSFEHSYANPNNTVNIDVSFIVVEFEFPTIKEKIFSISTPDVQTQFNANEHTYKATETYLI